MGCNTSDGRETEVSDTSSPGRIDQYVRLRRLTDMSIETFHWRKIVPLSNPHEQCGDRAYNSSHSRRRLAEQDISWAPAGSGDSIQVQRGLRDTPSR